jgi:phosphatidylcholine synthase
MNKITEFTRTSWTAWAVHILTASTAIIGLLTLYKIHQHQFIHALWLMGLAIFIDGIDGTLARFFQVKKLVPKIDGALLDNIVDFLNYVITPCFFLLIQPDMLNSAYEWIVLIFVALSSTYQFTQSDAKTPDHFFKGFPCYWNIVIFYLFIFNTSAAFNAILLIILSIMVFVPIKYVYPSRLDYLSKEKWLKLTMIFASIIYGFVCFSLIWAYPSKPLVLLIYSAAYIIFYLSFSIFRTAVPLIKAKLK